jgi:hypothetical protein
MSSSPHNTAKLPTEDGHTEAHRPVTSTAKPAELVQEDSTATSVPTASGVDDEFGARNAAAPKFRRAIVPVDSIIDEDTFGREVNDPHVATLAVIVERYGLRQPITVTPSLKLLAGQRWLAAVKRLGWQNVEVVIDEVAP